MKTVKEMSIIELSETLDVMKNIDSPEAKKLAEDIKAEQARREAEAEAKRKAAEERKKAEEAKKAEAEAKRESEALDKELGMFEAQKGVIGKCYKKVFYDTNYLMPTVHYTAYYKVVGVYEDKAIVSFIKKYEHSDMISKAITYINIEDLLNKNEHYTVIPLKEFNTEYKKAEVTFGSLSDVFNRFFKDTVFF